ncbi:MAG: glycosyltransferase 61 family protein [Chitinophagales bacterium]
MQKNLLYPEHTIHRKLPVNYAEMHTGKDTFIHTTEKINASYLLEIKDAYISPFGVVFKNGFVVKESVYSMFKPNKQLLSFYKKILLNKVRHISGDCVVAHHAYYQNYYHFLLEIMPRLFVIKNEAHHLKLIINNNLPSFVKEYISLFNFKEIIYLHDYEIAKAEKIIFPTFLSRGLSYNEIVMREMSNWLCEKLFDNNIFSPERIFISRSNAKYRKTENENEVFELLQKKGFVKFDLQEPNIRAQANFFKNAKYIVGSHGAGFSNMIFSKNCLLAIDIIHEQHPQDCFYNLASIFGVDYYYFQCKGTGVDSYANNDNIIVDLIKFETVCNQLIL